MKMKCQNMQLLFTRYNLKHRTEVSNQLFKQEKSPIVTLHFKELHGHWNKCEHIS